MKRKISYISALLAMMFVAGCQKEADTTSGTLPADGIIRVTVGVGETRAMSTDYVSQNGFGLFVGSTYANKLMTKSSGEWATQDGSTMFWGSGAVDIKAYAPWKADATATSLGCNVSSDQSVEANFSVSDLVVMNNAAFDPTTGLVGGKLPVVLNHVMSKLQLSINYGGTLNADNYTVESAVLRGTKLDGTYDFSTFTTSSATESDILMHSTTIGTTTVYEAIVVPQAVDAGDQVVVAVKNRLSNEEFTFKYSLAGVKIGETAFTAYESTKVYSLAMTLKTDELSASLTVAPWDDGGTITAVADEVKEIDWDEDEEINIKTMNDFWEFVKRVNAGDSFLGKTFTLACDITSAEKPAEYSMVSLPLISFAGTFDGDGHTVNFGDVTDSYTATANGQTRQLAGFCLTNSGNIMSLKVTGSLTGDDSYTEDRNGTTSFTLYGGGIVENNTGNILGCQFSGTVQMTAGAKNNNQNYWDDQDASATAYAGGIAARNSGTIDGCSVLSSTVYSDSNPLCYYYYWGWTETQGTCSERSGGIVANNSGTVTLCAVRGTTLTMWDGYAGGIVGYHNSGSVKGCYSADITFGGNSGNGRGGITGGGTSNVSYCQYLSGDANRVCGNTSTTPSNCGTFSSASNLNTNYISAMNSNATGTLYQFVSGGSDYPTITLK